MKYLPLIPAVVFALSLTCSLEAQNQPSQTLYYNSNSSPAHSATPTPAPARSASPARATATPARATATPARKAAKDPSPTPTPAPRATATPTPLVKHENVNDIARFIAGLPPEKDAQLLALAKTPEWTAYSTAMSRDWPRFDFVKLSRIRLWTANEFAKKRINAVFYPFSGPDFIYAATYFPQASTYILCGLEPVGDVPTVEKVQPLVTSIGWLQASFKTLLNAGYFVTQDMSVQLKASPMQGTVPIMCVMLARLGDRITSISTGPDVAEIHFVPPSGGAERTLVYFSADLSNGGLHKGSLLDYVRKAHANVAYVKSASYLMHEDEFSGIRNFLLTQMDTIVQDDTGIPLRDFDQRRWKLKLFGTYTAPLDIFAKYNQPDLADLYSKTKAVPPLDFGVGYHWSYKDANLLVATASAGQAPAPAPAVSPTHR